MSEGCSKIAVVYYSATGTVFTLAEAVRAGAMAAGAQVRLRRVAEIAPSSAIARNRGWREHLAATEHVPIAAHEDLLWADGIVFGTPARFGNIASQLKQFFDTLTGLWARDLLVDKVYSGFTSSASAHGGQETTLLALYNSVYHFGGVLVPPGFKGHANDSGGNPYGASHSTGEDGSIAVDETALASARAQGHRVATMAAALKTGLASPRVPAGATQ
ncbi:NAD(P)H:quinone oxidoreductase [Amycolatopsis sp. NPDC004368]